MFWGKSPQSLQGVFFGAVKLPHAGIMMQEFATCAPARLCAHSVPSLISLGWFQRLVGGGRQTSFISPTFLESQNLKGREKTVDFRALSIVSVTWASERQSVQERWTNWELFFRAFFLSFLKPIQLGRRDMPTPTPRTPAMYLLPPRMPSVKPPPGNMYWPVWCGNHPALLN